MDEMAHFDRERIPERVVHAKGAGEGVMLVWSGFHFQIGIVVELMFNCRFSRSGVCLRTCLLWG